MNRPSSTSERRHLDGRASGLAGVAAVVGIVGVVASVALGRGEGWPAFFRSYILNYVYVLSLALGALFFVLLQHATRAGWSVVVRRLAEFVAGAMPALAVLFLPILIPVLTAMKEVYSWANADEVQHNPLLAWKHPYLNAPFFIVRCVIYFVVWTWLANYYLKQSLAQDATGDVQHTRRMQRLSGVGMLLYALTVTFFAFDVIKSLTPEWFSTIFGVYFFSGGVTGFFALLALLMLWLQATGRLTRSITAEHYHDVGKLVFGFTVFWAYIAYSQYVLIWYANIPEEVVWYAQRQASAWWVNVSLLLLLGHFVVPFLALLSRVPKRRKAPLAIVAAWILVMHWIDVYYLVAPSANADHAAAGTAAPLHLTDFTLLVGLGGIVMAVVMRRMGGRALLPERDPRLGESLAFENI